MRLRRHQPSVLELRVKAQIAELDAHAHAMREHIRLSAEYTALRDSEPKVWCQAPIGGTPCTAEMRLGDYRCHCCGARNPVFVRRAMDPPELPRLA